MNGLFASLFQASAPASPSADDDFWYGAGGAASESGIRVTAGRAIQVTAVLRCVAILSQTLAALPLHIYRKTADGADIAGEHPLAYVLRTRPNPWQSSYEFRQMLMAHVALRGDGFARIIPGPRGAVDQLIPLNPDRVVVETMSDGRPRYRYWDAARARNEVLVQDEVFHVKSFVYDGHRGIDPIAAAANAIGLSIATEKHGGRLFRNSTRPSGVLQTPKKLDEPTVNRLRAQWQQVNAGLDNTGRTVVLEDGLEWKQIALTSDQAQFLETRGFQVEEIARLYGVPLFLLGSMSKNTTWGAGIEQMMIAFVTFTMQPYLVAWEQAMQRDLITAPDRYFVKFSVEGLLRGDSKARAEFYASGIQNEWLSPNEVRRFENLNPRQGGDLYRNPNVATGADKASDKAGGKDGKDQSAASDAEDGDQ